ncbi:TPA: Fe-S protein assembly co-chaperone HscB, partial [Neisseria meningitidis]
NDLESLKNLDNEIRDEQEKLFCGLKQSFARQDYDTAAQQVRQGRFLDKLRNEISSAL